MTEGLTIRQQVMRLADDAVASDKHQATATIQGREVTITVTYGGRKVFGKRNPNFNVVCNPPIKWYGWRTRKSDLVTKLVDALDPKRQKEIKEAQEKYEKERKEREEQEKAAKYRIAPLCSFAAEYVEGVVPPFKREMLKKGFTEQEIIQALQTEFSKLRVTE